MVTEEEEDIMEDCLENRPPQVLAASSKAAAADVLEILASVSTYMTASICLQNESAMLDETWERICLYIKHSILPSHQR